MDTIHKPDSVMNVSVSEMENTVPPPLPPRIKMSDKAAPSTSQTVPPECPPKP